MGKSKICQENIRSKLSPRPNNYTQNRAREIDILNLQPMDMISIDWVKIDKKDYLVTVDHKSGYLWAYKSI